MPRFFSPSLRNCDGDNNTSPSLMCSLSLLTVRYTRRLWLMFEQLLSPSGFVVCSRSTVLPHTRCSLSVAAFSPAALSEAVVEAATSLHSPRRRPRITKTASRAAAEKEAASRTPLSLSLIRPSPTKSSGCRCVAAGGGGGGLSPPRPDLFKGLRRRCRRLRYLVHVD